MGLTDSKQTRLAQLKALQEILAEAIDSRPGARDLASLAKQYRETLSEIEAIEGVDTHGDEISEILTQREQVGKPGPVRKSRS